MKIRISRSKFEMLKKKAELDQTPEQKMKLENAIQQLQSKIGKSNVQFYKDTGDYLIYTLNETVGLSGDELSFIANMAPIIYLSVLNGKMAIFLFKK